MYFRVSYVTVDFCKLPKAGVEYMCFRASYVKAREAPYNLRVIRGFLYIQTTTVSQKIMVSVCMVS